MKFRASLVNGQNKWKLRGIIVFGRILHRHSIDGRTKKNLSFLKVSLMGRVIPTGISTTPRALLVFYVPSLSICEECRAFQLFLITFHPFETMRTRHEEHNAQKKKLLTTDATVYKQRPRFHTLIPAAKMLKLFIIQTHRHFLHWVCALVEFVIVYYIVYPFYRLWKHWWFNKLGNVSIYIEKLLPIIFNPQESHCKYMFSLFL